jgi:hypothetical protein
MALLAEGAMSASSLPRRRVDGRDKPGHDDTGSKAQPQRERPEHFLAETRNACYTFPIRRI